MIAPATPDTSTSPPLSLTAKSLYCFEEGQANQLASLLSTIGYKVDTTKPSYRGYWVTYAAYEVSGQRLYPYDPDRG
jgi:hypothetical protein